MKLARNSTATALAAAGWEILERAGDGASATVWRARRADGRIAAIKMGDRGAIALREAELVARVGRRWGPEALDAGRVGGAAFVALEWTEGEVLETLPRSQSSPGARERLSAIVAHGVGRALEELHAAGVRHGDVKPANILVSGRAPRRDVPEERGATLIDLSLAAEIGEALQGATPRYLAPESPLVGPAADIYALGIVLGEILGESTRGEASRWVEAMTARAPGARPSAAWIAERAARALGLAREEKEQARARVSDVKRVYLAVRAHELYAGARASERIAAPAREWIDEACRWAAKLGASEDEGVVLGSLGPIGRARWMVGLCGPSAASWPAFADEDDGSLATRLRARAERLPFGSWTREDLETNTPRIDAPAEVPRGEDRWTWIARELGRAVPDVRALSLAEDDVAGRRAPRTVAIEAARAFVRRGEVGRAWAQIAGLEDSEALALRADLARRRGDLEAALELAARAGAPAVSARIAWDAGDLDRAEKYLESARGAVAAEVRGLVAYGRGSYETGLTCVLDALAEEREIDACARLEATRGMLEHARGDAAASLAAFGRAVDLAAREGAIVEEATYLVGEAAAATDEGRIGRALASATRAALLWERLGRPAQAARAWLSRASALATIGATHAAEEAAAEAMRHASEARDARAHAYARWAIVEGRPTCDPVARDHAERAALALADGSDEDRLRASSRLLSWGPEAIDLARVAEMDRTASRACAPARWEWWGARARAILTGTHVDAEGAHEEVLSQLKGLVDVPAPLASRGPALECAVRLATEFGDGDAARRFEVARRAAAKLLRDGTPAALVSSLAAVAWARLGALEDDVELLPAQVAQLETIVRSLATRDHLRTLLEQVLDTLVLWSGVERGLLLLRAPDGRLVPRAARNLARRDLAGEQLALSQGIARRAAETGEAVVATDAYAQHGSFHASVHALRLRSVLAVPLIARGDTLGVVYLDDRTRRAAFGPRELAWVRLLASQAAVAIADARDQVLLKRAVRRAERAQAHVQRLLSERDAELVATRAELQATRGEETRFRYDAIVGRSAPMRELLRLVDRVTASDVPVLLVGESGTGKELVARALHTNGARSRSAYIGENCASVPESLLEATLFGHVKGAFTGASSTRAGLFDAADGGTLFLDEIGEMPVAMQSKLLRVLQDGEVRPVGGDRSRKVDVRVLAATHRDLEAMVAAGTFREDLFYRLNVVQLRVPPLRERTEDIPLLVAHMLEKHARERGLKVTRAAMEKLVRFPWPGNVRQLENEIRRAIVLADARIDVADLSAEVSRGGPGATRSSGLDLKSRVDALEAELVKEAIGKTRGNQTRAAELLGVSRFGLQKMMRRLKVR